MKLNLKTLAVTAGVLSGLAGSALVASPASAVPAASNSGAILAGVGSDTTYWMMNGLSLQYNVDTVTNSEVPQDRVVNVQPFTVAPFPTASVVPVEAGSGACGNVEVQYDAVNLPPGGSSSGITKLVNDTDGCTDFARSSRGLTTADPATLEGYAYALDALSWAKFPGSKAPANLTQQNLIDIYTCDPVTHLPFADDWSDVGGAAGAIKKYAPQTASGTYSFFKSKLLNGANVDAGCAGGPSLTTFLEEHDARGVLAADKTTAILPFSYANWTAASKAVIADLRVGVTLGNINGVKASASTVNETGATHFFGTRYVFNILKTTAPRYDDTMRAFGVDNAGNGWLCNNTGNKIIKLYGFTPLKKLAAGGGVTTLSYCRKNPAAL